MSVRFQCRLDESAGPLPHFWEHTVGSGHATLALRSDWQLQLRHCHQELGFRHVRFHGLLADDVGTLVEEQDRLIYSFFNADRIWDYLLSIGMKPFVELSFMPTTLASGHKTVFHYRGNVTPPRDPRQWAKLIRKLVGHWVERYGLEEVRQWYFEVWNEPNQPQFWTGTRQRYFDFYRTTARTLKDVDASLRVGGPATSKNAWVLEFLDYCTRHRVPVDFVSTHHYPTDAVGGGDTHAQLANSRRSILREQTQGTFHRSRGLPIYYTEWSSSSNPRDPLHDEPYAAAFLVKTILEANGLVEGYSWWTFTDIFEETYFPSCPFHGGFGLLNLHGIPKPAYRAFELLHRLGDKRLVVDGLHPTVNAWAVHGNGNLTILLTNFAPPEHPLEKEKIELRLDGVPRPRSVVVERIDQEHANPKVLWSEMGEPEYLSTEDVKVLEAASRLVAEPQPFRYESDTVELVLELPPLGVAAVTLKPVNGRSDRP